jgi:hypothetical protein
MIHFCCCNVGPGYAPEYVSNLYAGINRHYQGDWDLTAITDHRTKAPVGNVVWDQVLRPPVPPKNYWWWSKLNMFRDDIWLKGNTVVYIDLDSLVVGDLTPLTKVEGFGMISWGATKNPYGSGVMVFRAGEHVELFNGFDIRQRDRWKKGDQQYIAQQLDGGISRIGPELVSSWKRHLKRGTQQPDGECIVAMHGIPKPHEFAEDSWEFNAWTGNVLADC